MDVGAGMVMEVCKEAVCEGLELECDGMEVGDVEWEVRCWIFIVCDEVSSSLTFVSTYTLS